MTRFEGPLPRAHSPKAGVWGVRDLRNRPPVATASAVASGTAIYAIEVFENFTPVIAGDDAFNWEIPEDLDGAVLTKVEGYVNSPSSSVTVQIQVANEREAGGTVDMLTSKVVIEVGELNSKDAAAQPVVNVANQLVAWGDHLRIDVDSAGTGTLGMGMILYFVPLATLSLVVTGSKGDPGGITSFTGQWSNVTAYTAGQAVSNNGSSYVARIGSTGVEPGVTPGWQTSWMVLFDGQHYTSLTVAINNLGRAIDVGQKAIVPVPFPATITSLTLAADRVGDIQFDVWKETYAGYPPTVLDSIVGTSPPKLIAAQKAVDTALVGWTTAVATDDILVFSVASAAFVTMVSLGLKLARI